MAEEYGQGQMKEKPPKRKFWQNLLIMDSGDLKKLLSLSSLMLSFVFLLVYIISYLLLMPLLDKIFHGPVFVVNLIETLVPSLIATALIMVTWPVFRDKRVIPSAFLWLIFFSALIFIVTMVMLRDDAAAQRSFMSYFFWHVLPPLIIGNAAAWIRYYRFLWK